MPVRDVTIIDLWTDSNRGDEALQASLVAMLRRRFPGARVTGVFRFGANEIEAARPEIGSTAAVLDEVLGGIRRTHYAEGSRRISGAAHQASSALSFVEAVLCVLCFRLLGDRSRRVLGDGRHRSLRAVRDADIVVWKGKNFRDYEGMTAVTRAMTLGGAGWFAGLLRTRIDCVNASFWPVEHRLPRFLYRRAFRRCASLTVRDHSSLANARALFGDRVRLEHCPDLSFALLEDPPTLVGSPLPTTSVHDVALTVTAWGHESRQARYLESLERAAARLRDLGAARFVIVPQVTRAAEDNSALVARLNDRLRQRVGVEVDVVGGPCSIPELLVIYAGCRMLIGARMHSCVFARSVGVPFVALSYDSGPKWEVLTDFWDQSLVLDYGSDASTVADACERVWNEGRALLEASEPRWRSCVQGAAENVALLDG